MNNFMALSSMLAQNSVQIDSGGFGMIAGLLACGMIVIGAGLSISKLSGKASESIARQPEAGGRIFTCMIISAALIEGFTLFALLICFLSVIRA